jgi:hypothetical protein
VTSARDITEAVRPPRAVYLDWPLGHQGGGRPFDAGGQRRVIEDALQALETITEPGTIVDLPYAWGSGKRQDSGQGLAVSVFLW